MKPLLPSVRESLEQAAERFASALPGSPAESYLRGRGLDPAWARVAFRLGYVADNTVPGFERFAGRLAIPNLCAAGHPVGFKFRDLNPDSDFKYDMPTGQQQRIFNLRALVTDDDTIAVTEGEMDTIALGSLGVASVAVPGVHNWNKRRHWRLFEGFRRVVLIRDNDEAGGELAKKMLDTDLPVVVVAPPGAHKDVNDALVAGLGDELVRLVNGASR